MANDGLDSSSFSSLSNTDFQLFPKLGEENAAEITSCGSQKSGSSLLDLGENNPFGFWQKSGSNAGISRQTEPHTDSCVDPAENGQILGGFRESIDITEFPVSERSDGRFSGDGTTLNSRVLRAIGSQLAVGESRVLDAQHSKFKYVNMYANTLRTLEPTSPDSRSVFGVSELDEYHQFVRLSELNQQIEARLASEQLSPESNVLAVLDAGDFHKLYNPHPDVEIPETPAKKGHFRFFPWGRGKFPPGSSGENTKPKTKTLGKTQPSTDALAQTTPVSSLGRPQQPAFLHRRLEVRHLQMISMGGTLGVGLYLNVGKALTIAGGLGTLLAMIIVGLVVLATVISFCEMVTFVSVVDGVSGLGSRFVDESFGFATGWLYFFSFSFGLAGEVVAAVIILSYFSSTEILTNAGSTAGFVTLFLLVCILSNVLSIKVFGEIEYITSLIKVIITLLGIVIMIVVNRGGLGNKGAIGFKYWQRLKSDFEHNLIFGPFRPSFNLSSDGTDPESAGIGGNSGRFLSLLVAVVVAAYAYSGTEIVCIAACEAKNPRKALPSATNRVFWRILIFYCLSSFVVSLNIYAGDPRLLRYYSGTTGILPSDFATNYAINYVGGAHCHRNSLVVASIGTGAQSPWIIAFQSAGACSWSSVVNALLFFFALSCGISHLYVSSRTIYSLSLQHKAPGFLRTCNRNGTPYYAVLVAVIPGLLSYTCVSQKATTVFQNLTSLISSSGVFVWFSMCLSYVRFYYGLKRRPDIISRDDKSYPYRSAFQPYSAIFGLCGTSIILLSMGYVVFLKDHWNTWFFFSSYGTFMIFAALYFTHWLVVGTKMSSLEALDFDSGRREKDIYIWDGGREYNLRKGKDLAHKIVDWLA